MVVEVTTGRIDQPPKAALFRITAIYFRLLVCSILVIALASFVRDRGQVLANISLYAFLISFLLSLWRTQAGLLVAVFLLTVTPSLHEQLNALFGTAFHGWAYPGVDCCLGFLAAWALKGGLGTARAVLDRFPGGPLMLFHAWISLSAIVVVGRNIWQSASEFSLRGLAYNVWLTRGISWHDDYYPLQDPFFYGVALSMLIGTRALLHQGGARLMRLLVGVVLAGAATNVIFALWQKATGKGWVNGLLPTSVNAFWPDLHSFGVFMAMALILAYGYLVTRPATATVKTTVSLGMLTAGVGLYLSGSRSTLFLVFALLVGWTVWMALRLRGWRRAIPVLAAIAVVAAAHWTLDQGYRDVSYASLGERLKVVNLKSVNEALSYRPEIWVAALRMYLAFPFFGLGQGAFYRLSAIPEFSGSQVLVSLGGDGVHNELLRMLVELGPIGLGIVLFIVFPFVRLGRRNFQWVSFYALAAVALGSVYTNAILVRELLMLSAIFAGSYLWEAQAVGSSRWHPPGRATTRRAAVVLVALALASLTEVALSFSRYPFNYGQRCLVAHPLGKDGWTEGVLRVPVPSAAVRAEVVVVADRPDLNRRSVGLDVSIMTAGGSSLATLRHTFVRRETVADRFELTIPQSADGKRFLELKPSSCYVPLNLGVTYDPRRLGLRVNQIRFSTAAGVEAQ